MLEKAIEWVRNNSVDGQGIVVTPRQNVCYPEVTGYFIPTLLSIGEQELAGQYARWLTSVQQQDGSFRGTAGNVSYAFDTGQVVRGWVAMLNRIPELEQPLRRACDWLIETADSRSGRLRVPLAGSAWSLGRRGEVNEGIHLYALAPLKWAGEALSESGYTKFVKKSLDYYLKNVNLTDFKLPNALTHFFAYIQEGLLDLACEDEARLGMACVGEFQQTNGAVPAYSDVSWVCSTGLAQLAMIWHRLGDVKRGDAAIKFMGSLQNHSGGFFGSYGVGAEYFPDSEISWAVKFAIEAEQHRIAGHFDQTVNSYQSSISESDDRVQAVLRHLGDLNAKRVLDAGCGKGRYSEIIKRRFPTAQITAMDVSSEMLRHVPEGIQTLQHGILDIPFADGEFDAVICIESLEHVVQIEAGVKELARVLAPGGTLIIIDKNKEKLGLLKLPDWEKWFGKQELIEMLNANGLEADGEFIGYDHVTQPDGLFICWHGTRPIGQSTAIISSDTEQEIQSALRDARWKDAAEILGKIQERGVFPGVTGEVLYWMLTGDAKNLRESVCALDTSKDNVAKVVDDGLCVGCGACKGICPHDNVIHYEMVNGIFSPIVDVSKCQNCGLCSKVCPGAQALAPDESHFTKSDYDRDVGYYRSFWEGYSAETDIRKNAASGGIVTAVLSWMLKSGKADYAVCADFPETSPLQADVMVLSDITDVKRAKGSKYLPVPIAEAIQFISENNKKFVVVGLPCHLQAFRTSEKLINRISDRVALYVGLFCQNISNYKGFYSFLAKQKINPEDILRFSFRGNGWPGGMTVELSSGDRKFIPLSEYWNHLQHFNCLRCQNCPDGLAEHADLSIGDAWLPEYRSKNPGVSIVVTRTDRGNKLFDKIINSGEVVARKSSLQRVKQSQPWLIRHKKQLLSSRRRIFTLLDKTLPQLPENEIQKVDINRILETYTFLQKGSRARRSLMENADHAVSKVLIINQCGMWNLGDEALFQSTYELVRDSFPHAEISTVTHTFEADKRAINTPLFEHLPVEKERIDIFNNVRKGLSFLGQDLADEVALRRCFADINVRKLVKEYMSADFIISRGGDNFTEDYGYPKIFVNALELALWLNKNAVILGESIGPFKNRQLFDDAKTIFSHLSAVVVREEISYRYLLETMTVPIEKAMLFPDMAFLLSKDRETQTEELKNELKIQDNAKYIALFPSALIYRWVKFTAEPRAKMQAITDFYVQLCSYLSRELGYKVLLIPHVFKDNKSDRLEAEKIKKRLSDNEDVVLVEKNYHFWDYRQLIETVCDFVISGRMHPCISALSAGKPAISLVYSHKSEGIVGELFNCKELLVDVRTARSGDQLLDNCKKVISKLLSGYSEYIDSITATYKELYGRKNALIKIIKKIAFKNSATPELPLSGLPTSHKLQQNTAEKQHVRVEVKDTKAVVSKQKKHILYYGAGWPTNIGNAFIDMGAMAILQRAVPEAQVAFASEMPRWFFGQSATRTRNEWGTHNKSDMENAFDIASAIKCDLAVFSGMAMCDEFLIVNGKTILEMCGRKIPVLLLGTGGFTYTKREKENFSKFLNQVKPIGFVSRDDRSYDTYADAVTNAYRGIDCGFFVSEAYKPFSVDLPPYVVASFDSLDEPNIETDDKLLIRAHHDCWAPPEAHFQTKNTLISDIPQDYLTLYANAEEVHSDRVHACVATLAYGGRAKFYHPTPRGSLFSVIGAEAIKDRAIHADSLRLQEQKQKQIEIVSNLISQYLN